MAKDKSGSKAAAAPVASKSVDSVKAGRVTKPAKSSKAVPDTKHKKERDPSPDSASDDSDGTSDSSASSDSASDSEDEVDTKADKKVVNGGSDSGSDSDSSGSDSEDEEPAKKTEAPKVNGAAKVDSAVEKDAPKTNGKAKASLDDDDSDSSDGSSDSDSDSDSGSEDGDDAEVDTKAGAKKPADDSSSASSSEDEAELPAVKAEEAAKKRKAEAPIDQTPKKAKVNSNEDQTGAVANLFIGNLSWNIDEEWLTREFEEFGEIKGVRVITDRDSGRSKGFGYVEFMAVDSAVQAFEAKNGELLDGRNIRIDYSTPRPPKNNDGFTPQQRGADRAQRYGDVAKPPSKTLFVGNVSFNANEQTLTELFEEHGTINAVRLPTDRETGELKGFGYVEFSSIDEAKGAFEACQGAAIEGRPIRLDYAGERSNDSPRGGGFSRGGGGGRGRGGFNDRGGRGGGFGDRGRGRGGARGGRGGTTNRGGFGDFSGKKVTF